MASVDNPSPLEFVNQLYEAFNGPFMEKHLSWSPLESEGEEPLRTMVWRVGKILSKNQVDEEDREFLAELKRLNQSMSK